MNAASDPYLYPGTNVLRNVPGLRNENQLAAFETAKTAGRIYEISLKPVAGAFDAAHLKAIHQYIFQDVFVWAGQYRTTMLGKAEEVGHPPIWFTPPHLLEQESERIFGALHESSLLRGLRQSEFSRRAALLLAEVNRLHPFREGNGRTQRLFLTELARTAGHTLYWDVVSRERMIRSSIEAHRGVPAMLARLVEEITDETRVRPLRRAIAFLSREKFNWNDTYISTTTPGRTYSGKLVGRDGNAFMMRSDDNCILVGQAADISPNIRSGDHLAFRAGGGANP
jgi:cell filamentation protein